MMIENLLKTAFRRKPASRLGAAPAPSAPAKKPVAVVTMAYNEADMLPFWCGHYFAQVGEADCYILDHGSQDGSTAGLACNVIRLPRSPFDEVARAGLVSDFCTALLRHYEAVLYTDVDELVLADPVLAGSLADFARRPDLPPVVTTLGMDVVHVEAEEAPLDPARPVFAQRQWARPFHTLCKPTFIREPHQWGCGFHLMDYEPKLSGLYLFHIAYADTDMIRRRQAKRNTSPPVAGGDHHRMLPDEIVRLIQNQIPWDRRRDVDLNGCEAEAEFVGRLKPFSHETADALWRIPARFRGAGA